MQRGQRPLHHLKYYDFKEGDYAMVCVIPKTRTLGWIDNQYRQINLKLQPRYAGPYLVRRKISPVVYVLEVDGTEKTFHAVNMKPYQGKKDSLTPFVEPGYERLEAGQMRKPEKPLLLSPDHELNQQAATGYRRRKLTAKQQTTKAVNAARSRIEREEQAKRRLADSQSEDVWILVDAEAQDPDEDDEEDRVRLEEDSQTAPETDNEQTLGESFTLVAHQSGETANTHSLEASNTDKIIEETIISPEDRTLILETAQIMPGHEERVESWLQEITSQERLRKSRLSEQDRRLESELATDQEYIGWILRKYAHQWERDNQESLGDEPKGEGELQC